MYYNEGETEAFYKRSSNNLSEKIDLKLIIKDAVRDALNPHEMDKKRLDFRKSIKYDGRIPLEKEPQKEYTQNNDDEVKDMSIVGIFKCSDGVLGFGDTKGTVNRKEYDKERGIIKKVFQNDYLILITYGNNKVGDEKLEDILERIVVEENNEVGKTATHLQEYIEKRSLLNYNFAIYSKEENRFYEYTVGKIYSVVETRGFIYSGADLYRSFIKIFEDANFNYKRENGIIRLLTVKELKEKLNRILTFLIKELDDTVEFYNPVGLPILFEEYIEK